MTIAELDDAAAHAYFAGMAEIRAARADGAPARVRFKRALAAARENLGRVDDDFRRDTIRTMLRTEAFRREQETKWKKR
jgi:hypothetical protein